MKTRVMKKFRFFFAFLVALTFFSFTQYASAHDGQWGTDDSPLVVDWVGDSSSLDLTHVDADPYKGWATLYLKNICGADWGDFHLKIIGTYLDHVNFCDNWGGDYSYEPQLWIKEGYSYVQDTDLTWTIDNDSIHGATINLFFYGDPIDSGDQAYIKVYTDNTWNKWPSFELSGYATPVPEPATLTLVGLGVVGLLLRARNKMS